MESYMEAMKRYDEASTFPSDKVGLGDLLLTSLRLESSDDGSLAILLDETPDEVWAGTGGSEPRMENTEDRVHAPFWSRSITKLS